MKKAFFVTIAGAVPLAILVTDEPKTARADNLASCQKSNGCGSQDHPRMVRDTWCARRVLCIPGVERDMRS